MNYSEDYSDCPRAPAYRAKFLRDIMAGWEIAHPGEEMPSELIEMLEKTYNHGLSDGAEMVCGILSVHNIEIKHVEST